MTHFMPHDKVMRKVTVCGIQDIWYGEVAFWGHLKSGRLVVVVEGSDFTFVSDPSHLEKVHAQPSQVP